MTHDAAAAAKAFYDTLRARGQRVDQAQLEKAWEAAAEAAKAAIILEYDHRPDS